MGKSKNNKANLPIKEAVANQDQNIYKNKNRILSIDQFHGVYINSDPNLNKNSNHNSKKVYQPKIPNQFAPIPSCSNLTNNSSGNPPLQNSTESNFSNTIVPSLPKQPLKPRGPVGWDIGKPDSEQEPEPDHWART